MLSIKTNMPQIGRDVVRREKLYIKLCLLPQYKFAYLSAPAGYGKTTAVVDFITQENLKYAWVSLDADDNDPMRFWINVIAAISRCNGKDEMQISLNVPLITSKISINLLIDTIKTIPVDFVLVIDDYHLIDNEVILKSMEYFVKYLPQNVSLIVISRKEPDEMISLLQAKGNVLCLNKADFSFDYDNTVEFFSQKGLNISEEKIAEIYRYSEGWAAALVGAFLYFKDKEISFRSLTALAAKGKHIHVLFKREVFEQWPDEVKDLLIKTSFLDKLCGSLCAAITQNEDSARILEMLAQNNNFVIGLDAENEWFRYHHLFQEFLLNLLELLGNEEKQRLYRLAGEWYAGRKMIEDAVKWLLNAEEYEKAMPLIMDYAVWTVQNPSLSYEYLLWKKWIENLPEKLYQDNVTVYTYYSWIAFMNNENDVAAIWVKKAWNSFERVMEILDKTEIDAIKACILFAELNIDISNANLTRVLFNFDRLDKIKLSSPVKMGELNWFEASMLKTPYGFKGRLENAKVYLQVTDRMYNYMGNSASYIAVIIAECYYEQNKLDQLNQILIRNMGPITEIKRPGVVVPAFILLAKSKMAKGDVEEAYSTIEKAKKLLDKKNGSVWNYHLDVFNAMLHLRAGNVIYASEIINEIDIYDELSAIRESEYILYTRLLMHTNHLENALILLNRLEHFVRKENRFGSLIEILCLTAICHSLKGDFQNAFSFLKQALSLGFQEGYVRTFLDEREPMAVLLDKYIAANRSGSDSEYISYARELFRQTNEYIGIMGGAMPTAGAAQKRHTESFLGSKEIEILKLMAQDKSNSEIVKELYLSLNTIKQYNSRIFDKLGAKNRREAVIKARNLGIID